MYVLLYTIIFLNVTLITKIKYKTIIKPNILFSIMWCAGASVSSLGLYGIYKPSFKVHLYSITAIFIFNFVYILTRKCAKNNNDRKIIGELRFKVIYIANIICWIFLSRILANSLKIIGIGGFKLLRTYAFDGLATTLELIIFQWIVTPVFEATVIIAIVYIIMKKKSKWINLIAIIDIVMNVTVSGGRYFIVKFIVYYILAFILIKSRKINHLSNIKINKKIILISVVSISTLTMMRSWHGTSIFKEVTLYFTSSFSFLDTLLKEDILGRQDKFMLGRGTLGFIYNIIIAPASLLLGIPYRGSDYILTQITATPRIIGEGIKYNALGTMIYPFLLDFGYWGVIIGTSFLSIVTVFIEKMLNVTNKLIYLCMYIYIGNIIFSSIMNYYLIFPSAGFTILALIVFIKSNTIKENEKEII